MHIVKKYFFSFFLILILGNIFISLASESSNGVDILGKENIVKEIYIALNNSNTKSLSDYFSEEIQLVTLHRAASPIEGLNSVLDSLNQMLSFVKNSEFVFISEPSVMGDVVIVEYMHHYELEGSARSDHNVSIFIIKNSKITKWLGYIHQK